MSKELVVKDKQVPVKLQDLRRFILFGREKLVSVRAYIRAIDKLGLAKEVREQKREEANMLAGALLDAEAKMGELLKETAPTGSIKGHRGGSKKTLPEGITHKQSSAFQTLAENKDIIEQVKADAEVADKLPTRAEVLWRARERKIAEKRKLLKSQSIPKGKFRVIYVDLPWEYNSDLSKGATRRPNNNYPVMDLETIKKFGEKVKEMSYKDCVLFMWITAPQLNSMNEVLEAWGFKYRTNIIWDKIRPVYGYYSAVRHEILIIAGKGTCTPTCDDKTIQSVASVQSIKKSSKHSEKPNEFRKIIEKLYPDHKKIELFARGTAPDGWVFWGNEVEPSG